ncbi:methyltransferase domain-containing protein [Alteromonas sp. KUL49]|uniref:class I SAM-dependent methyltransferase n=1 Tax=Alteromonas sp. KUL49 TaxID=2480798 RepID=UPI00102EFB5B|nr:methyltransferase domain-containing protein [Alteromonas sp. KUL49]TAP39770.1 methyltransferase domain-containing protein [Alteromonas sp. KUL49]GEA11769.1 hypothetical protein KUL49_21440 [Alteromonas sp. KUL49]
MSDFWSNYWKQGHLNSFGDSANDNYRGVIETSWTQFFADYSNEKDTIVDIGTGNGALIDIAVNGATGSSCQFIGVDYAALNIRPELHKNNVQFLEKTNAESLPLEDSSIAAVISQFGIEYTNFNKSIPEIARVLKPKGRVNFVIHYSNSSIVKPNRDIFLALQLVKGDKGLLGLLKDLVEAINTQGKQSALAERVRATLNERLSNISNKNGLVGTNFPAFLRAILNPSLTHDKKLMMFGMYESEMNNQFERLDDLLQASKTDEEVSSLCDLLEASGIPAKSSFVTENGEILGVNIEGTKGG